MLLLYLRGSRALIPVFVAVMFLTLALLPIITVQVGAMAPLGNNAQKKHAPSSDLDMNSIVDWGGGSIASVGTLNNKSRFGVIHGTQQQANFPLLYAKTTRSVGGADIVDENGVTIGTRSLVVDGISIQRFLGILEFTDENGNGLFDSRDFDSPDNAFKRTTNQTGQKHHEKIHRYASLRTAWNFTLVQGNVASGQFVVRLWAEDIPVKGSLRTVDLVAFTIRLNMSRSTETIDGIPWYEIELNKQDDNKVTSVTKKKSQSYTGTVVSADFKYDIEIIGWPTHGMAQTKLVLLTSTFFGYQVQKEFLRHIKGDLLPLLTGNQVSGDGGVVFKDGNTDSVVVKRDSSSKQDDRDQQKADTAKRQGTASNAGASPDNASSANKTLPTPYKPVKHIGFHDNWAERGTFEWVDHAKVDGTRVPVLFGVNGIRRVFNRTEDGIFSGIYVLGGFVYPTGKNIYHDPTFSTSEIEVFLESEVFDILPIGSVVQQLLLAVAAAVFVVLIKVTRRKGESKPAARSTDLRNRRQDPPGRADHGVRRGPPIQR